MLMHNLKQAEESRLARAKAQDRAAVEAEAEQAARERIGANSSRLEELKANELAEAEALALARIRAQSERTLAAQAEALRDAERKLELTVIDRRSTDLEAAREAANREAADIAAREAAEKRAGAEREAALAAQQRAEAATQATAAAEARRQAEIEKNSAVAARRRAQWAAFWAGARFKPVASVGALMLALGAGWRRLAVRTVAQADGGTRRTARAEATPRRQRRILRPAHCGDAPTRPASAPAQAVDEKRRRESSPASNARSKDARGGRNQGKSEGVSDADGGFVFLLDVEAVNAGDDRLGVPGQAGFADRLGDAEDQVAEAVAERPWHRG